MKRIFLSNLLLTACIFSGNLCAQDNLNSVPALKAHKIDSRIQLDGLLTETDWQEAPVTSDFRQTQPLEGEPATEKTEVRVIYDNDNLYIGVICFDHEPGRIVAQKLQRDSGVEDDDMFAVLLDTYQDRRNAYYLATNPNGVEEDGQIVDGAFFTNLDWDGVWEVSSKIHDRGWSAEFKIPLWNLRFASQPTQDWGINFTRIIKRKTEQVNWASWSRDNGGFLRISRAGDLQGLTGLSQSLNLQAKPYTLGKVRRDNLLQPDHIKDDKWEAGLDIKYGLTSSLTLDLTLNTDFAQVEADVDQINLTRFPLFFPEKREFFLESANIFHFGQAGFFGPPPFLLFFSRRVGIEGFDTIVPLLAGGRITGKLGKYSIGMIDILTDEKAGFPRTHFSVARISRDIFQRSKIGAMFTNRADIGGNHQQAYGADAGIWLSNVLEFQSFFTGTHDRSKYVRGFDAGQNSHAWMLAFDFTKDHWGWFASQMVLGKNFDPAAGFVLRNDIRRTWMAFRVSPQPNGRFLRRTDIRQSYSRISNTRGRLQDWDYGITLFNELSSGEFLNIGYRRIFERLDNPFDFRAAIQIPVGDYNNDELSANLNTSAKRKITGSVSVLWREFYGGELFNWGGGFGFVPNRHVSFGLNYNRNEIDLPQGSLNTDLFALRMNMAFTTHLFINGLFQYNSETNEFNTNLRLNFIHSPGSDLFVVFNESRGRFGEEFSDGLPARNREVIVKFTQLMRM
jgi:hypothetical protein